ncbi:hypothetical protein ACU686_07745 [Yinghuangia aomiensis]
MTSACHAHCPGITIALITTRPRRRFPYAEAYNHGHIPAPGTAPAHHPPEFPADREPVRRAPREPGRHPRRGRQAYAQQKRGKLKEEVILYTDDTKQYELARFKARQVIDMHAQHDVTAFDGTPLGMFSKNFRKSLLRLDVAPGAPGRRTRDRSGAQPVRGDPAARVGLHPVRRQLPAGAHVPLRLRGRRHQDAAPARRTPDEAPRPVHGDVPGPDARPPPGPHVAVAMDAIQNR